MLKFSTSTKVYFATILSRLLIFFLRKKKFLISRNGIKYNIDLEEGIDLGIFLVIGLSLVAFPPASIMIGGFFFTNIRIYKIKKIKIIIYSIYVSK